MNSWSLIIVIVTKQCKIKMLYHFKLFSMGYDTWHIGWIFTSRKQICDMGHLAQFWPRANLLSSPPPLDTTPHYLKGDHSQWDLGQVRDFSHRQGACDMWWLNNLKCTVCVTTSNNQCRLLPVVFKSLGLNQVSANQEYK